MKHPDPDPENGGRNLKTVAGKWIVVSMLCIAIFAPGILGIFDGHSDMEKIEKRKIAPLPIFEWNISTFHDFPTSLTKYLEDHFGLRKTLVQSYSLMHYHLFGRSGIKRVVVGRDGWLFYRLRLADTYGKNLFDDRQLAQIKHNLKLWKTWMSRKGIIFRVVIVPNKSTIYQYYLPSIPRQWCANKTRYDQVLRVMRQVFPPNEVLDLRLVLRSHKKKGLLYYRGDTHWTDLGAYYGIRSIISGLHVPTITRPQLKDYLAVKDNTQPSGLADMLMLNSWFEQDVPKFEPAQIWQHDNIVYGRYGRSGILTISNPAKPDGSSVIWFGDSCLINSIKFLWPSFRKSNYIWGETSGDIVEKYKPDVVVWEMSEALFDQIIEVTPPK